MYTYINSTGDVFFATIYRFVKRLKKSERSIRKIGVSLLLLFTAFNSYAQMQATGGDGRYRNSIYWFNFAGVVLGSGQSKTFNFTVNGVDVTAIIDNVVTTGGSVYAYRPGAFFQDRIDDLYNIGGKEGANTLVNAVAVNTDRANFRIRVYASLNGQPASIGLVFANAESDYPGAEYTQGTTNGTAWQLLEAGRYNPTFERQIIFSGGGSTARIECMDNVALLYTQKLNTTATAPLTINADLISGNGTTAMALGIMSYKDRGDAPETYGRATHILKPAMNGGTPAFYNTPVYIYAPPPGGTVIAEGVVVPPPAPRLGALPGDFDPDVFSALGVLADADNKDQTNDEDGVASFPLLYTSDKSYSVNVGVNAGATTATVAGWLDFNRNGTFEAGEGVVKIVPAGSSSATLTWTVPDEIVQGRTYARFRISASSTLTASSATQAIENGEAEDYSLMILPPPNPPVSGGNKTGCESSPISALTAGASVGAGQTLTWYDAPNGGNRVTNPILNTSGNVTYYAETLENGRPSPSRTAVTLTIEPAPAAPVSGGDQEVCAAIPGQKITATASVPAGEIITWYNAAKGGKVVADPSLETIGTVTYYAESKRAGCLSLSRTPVMLTLRPLPAAAELTVTPPTCTSPTGSIHITEVAGAAYSVDSGANYSTQLNFTGLSVGPVHQVLVKDANGCISASVPVVFTMPAPTAKPVTTAPGNYCQGSVAAPLIAVGTNLLWYTSATDGIGSSTVITPSTATAGTFTYYVTQTDAANGCESERTEIPVTVDEMPVAHAGTSQIQYNSGNFTLNATSPAVGSGYWTVISGTPATAISDDHQPNATISLFSGTTVTLRWTVINGTCEAQADVELSYVNKADIVTVKKTKDNAQTTYTQGDAVVYSIVVTNNGPSDARNVNIQDVAPANTKITNWTATVTNGIVTVPNTSGTGDLNETISILPNGAVITYEVTVQTPVTLKSLLVNSVMVTSSTPDPDITCPACTTVPLIPVIIPPKANNDMAEVREAGKVVINLLQNDLPGPSGNQLDPGSVDIVSYPASGTVIVNPDGSVSYSPNRGFVGEDVFSYRVKDENDLWSNVAVIKVNVVGINLEIPNVITPNGDGINDRFAPKGLEKYRSNKLTIYNRWNNKVYEKRNYLDEWDANGLNAGTYFYTLMVQEETGQWHTFNGYITVLR